MQEGQWDVALENGDIKRMTVEQLDDAFRLGIVKGTTRVREVGDAVWLPLSVAAGLDDSVEPPQQQPVEEQAPSARLGDSLPVPRPSLPASSPPMPAYSNSRVPPPVKVSRPSTISGIGARPAIPIATITRSDAPAAPPASSSGPPPLPAGAFDVDSRRGKFVQPPVPEIPGALPAIPTSLPPTASALPVPGTAPAAFSKEPPPLPADAFNRAAASITAKDLDPLPPAALGSSNPPPAASHSAALPIAPAPFQASAPFQTSARSGSLFGTAFVVAFALVGLLLSLQRNGVLGADLDSLLGQPGVDTPRGVDLFIAQQSHDTADAEAADSATAEGR
jgi:hypothetical protein